MIPGARSPRRPITVGICAWADPALIEDGSFYPKRSMTAEARLRFYASVFDAVEVNSSYYAIPDVRAVARWKATVLKGVRTTAMSVISASCLLKVPSIRILLHTRLYVAE